MNAAIHEYKLLRRRALRRGSRRRLRFTHGLRTQGHADTCHRTRDKQVTPRQLVLPITHRRTTFFAFCPIGFLDGDHGGIGITNGGTGATGTNGGLPTAAYGGTGTRESQTQTARRLFSGLCLALSCAREAREAGRRRQPFRPPVVHPSVRLRFLRFPVCEPVDSVASVLRLLRPLRSLSPPPPPLSAVSIQDGAVVIKKLERT